MNKTYIIRIGRTLIYLFNISNLKGSGNIYFSSKYYFIE
ncbi:hypothetical protein AC3_A0253 [Clostridium perfringens E str. JGS1987]|uniref:Uncharacterized protein n=1 Tax=Clostridium perfringens E str. JGS1987 TaxID=451755 RepID=B1BRC0_CLOPF|nr:hypothetical protein AC3_A0253 [Clostridium perfringens E str. JGS1987]